MCGGGKSQTPSHDAANTLATRACGISRRAAATKETGSTLQGGRGKSGTTAATATAAATAAAKSAGIRRRDHEVAGQDGRGGGNRHKRRLKPRERHSRSEYHATHPSSQRTACTSPPHPAPSPHQGQEAASRRRPGATRQPPRPPSAVDRRVGRTRTSTRSCRRTRTSTRPTAPAAGHRRGRTATGRRHGPCGSGNASTSPGTRRGRK